MSSSSSSPLFPPPVPAVFSFSPLFSLILLIQYQRTLDLGGLIIPLPISRYLPGWAAGFELPWDFNDPRFLIITSLVITRGRSLGKTGPTPDSPEIPPLTYHNSLSSSGHHHQNYHFQHNLSFYPTAASQFWQPWVSHDTWVLEGRLSLSLIKPWFSKNRCRHDTAHVPNVHVGLPG